jgi:hypothetical protein
MIVGQMSHELREGKGAARQRRRGSAARPRSCSGEDRIGNRRHYLILNRNVCYIQDYQKVQPFNVLTDRAGRGRIFYLDSS